MAKRGPKKVEVTDELTVLQESISSKIGKLLGYGLTQHDLAEAIQLYQPEISQLYRKKRVLSIQRFKQIDSELDKLITENVNPEEADSIVEGIEPEENYSTWLYDQLTELGLSIIEFSNESSLSYQTINLIVNGITTNPQFKTKKTIQETLERISKVKNKPIEKPNTGKEDDEKKLFVGLPFIKTEIDQVPDLIGVYAIHDRRGYPTYIGKGRLKTRLKDHSDRIAFASEKVASTFSFLILQTDNTKEEKARADKEAILMEKVLTKFAGNTILLNIQNTEDLSKSE